ncbi:fibrous sheath CABYR-binding protein-like [Eptesicus fuscus]|uniref:fibrous sheath CABYR-binding protein-like n=1 Tax=Eptesicus fuscus TaxID=29078 RepID=UPI0024046C85|nr:fibrous sheath CABYR-binding protein-like [Eptesicus fuscus]
MFSCCLPVSRGRGLKRGSDESTFDQGCHWVWTHPIRRLWPFTKWDRESSTRVTEEQQLVDENPSPAFTLEGQVGHTTEGQSRPEVHMASWGSGEPGPLSDQRWSPPQKPLRLLKPPTWKPLSQQRQIPIFRSLLEPPRLLRKFAACDASLEHQAHANHTGSEDLEPKEAEPTAPAQEAEEAPGVTPEVYTEEPHEALEAWAPPELLPPPAASPVAAVEPGPAWEAPADMTEAPPPLDEEPSLEPAQGPASEEELPPESPAAPAPEPQAETAHRLPSEKLVRPPSFNFVFFFVSIFCFTLLYGVIQLFIVLFLFWSLLLFLFSILLSSFMLCFFMG